jgi:hypothetical protein
MVNAYAASNSNCSASEGCDLQAYFACPFRIMWIISMPPRITRVRPMLGFKSDQSARIILGGIEMIHTMRKQQAKDARNTQPSLAEQLNLLAA